MNSSNAPVYKTKVDLSGVAGIAANQAVSGSITDYSYGFDDVYPDANTCLYLYLPAGETTATFGSQTFEGTVSAGDGNVLTASNAEKAPVSYIDKTGAGYTTKYYTVVTDTTSAWTTGWYVVNADTTISSRIEVTGNASLILTDGATLTASAGIHVPETASLDICGQSSGTGKLIANASDGNAAIGGKGGEKETTGTISVCSGTVEATGGSGGGAGIGGGANCYNGTNTRGTVAIYGGTITATGGSGGAGIGTGKDGQINNIILAGGTIEANGGGDSAQDIGMGGGTSTLNSVMEFDAGGEGFSDDGGEPVLQSVSGSETNYRYDLDIRGGSIYTSGGTEAVTAPDPYNSNYGELDVDNEIVYYAEADFGTGYANQPVSGTITVGDSGYQYSFNGVKTDAKGKLHLYAFGGEVVLTANNGYTFKGTINASSNKLEVQQQPLGGSISIVGNAQCGETLTVNTDKVTPDGAAETLSYTWYRCDSSDGTGATQIAGAAGSTYTLTGDDAGMYIKVVVASTEYSGSLSAVTTSTVQKIPATVTDAPDANNLVYSGSAQELVTAGETEGGTMMYRLGTDGTFSDQIPTGTDAGDYTVWYKVVGDENHSDTEPVKVDVTIAKKPLIVSVSSFSIRVGDSAPELALTYTGLVDGESVRPSDTPTFTITKSDNTEITLADAVKTAGTYTITRSNAGNTTFPDGANYAIQTETAGTLTVSTRSSGGTTTYPVQVEENSQNGGVQVSPKNAVPGTLVTVTPQPAPGYELATLTVLDQYGNEVDVNPLGNGNYSFKMPRSRVKVEATFYCTGSELCPTHHLADVLVKAWYHDAVDYVVEHGIMTGTSATTFEPNTTLSRAMVAQILYNLEGQPTVTGESTFTDSNTHWAAKAIAWAQKTGVVSGYGNNTFRPNQAVTREELAQMLYNYAEYKQYDLTASGDLIAFPDGNNVQGWAKTAMSWANGNQLINGFEDDTLRPGGDSTRAQAASILMNFDVNLVEE